MNTNKASEATETQDTVEQREHAQALREQKRKDRRSFFAAFGIEVERAARYRRSLSLAMIRLRCPPHVHQTVWDVQRNYLMAELHSLAPDLLRLSDFAGRTADCELSLCLPETDLAGAQFAVQKFVADPRIGALLARFRCPDIVFGWSAIEREQHENKYRELMNRAGRGIPELV